MKIHTSQFKENIKEMGKSIDSIITYADTTLHDELYAVTPLFEGNLLKSIMKQLDVESTVDIPLNTVINYRLGLLVNGSYEYLNFGNYVVYKSEKQEDTDTYKITCYDKMLYSMKQNEDLGITYPITIKNYLTAIANRIGLQLKDTTFANQDLEIQNELYVGLEYTYRDILDEISQATGSNIIINDEDQLEVKYFTDTEDTIDEEYLKDVNVKFGEKYGPINSIVLSRAAESDNVYLSDDESIQENGLCELKIIDNQIMNFNNRSDYLQGILDKLDGLYFYINDFDSTGICYYDVCDIYNISIGETNYQCVMLNDEINVTTGLEEIIHTDMPQESETDYTKADKTDRRINRTTLMVDKQNQIIQSVVENVSTYESRITSIEQDVDGIKQNVGDLVDYRRTVEGTTQIHLEDAMEEDMLEFEVKGNVTYKTELFPSTDLYPMEELYVNMEGSELR